ncbi:hypothetical protein BSNK01_07950 [Bacillaceae bacterium]
MAKKMQMQLYSFSFDLDAVPQIPLYSLPLPESWREYLRQFKEEGSYRYPFKLKGLGAKLEAVFPSILSCHFSRQAVEEGKPWIVSTEKLDLDIVKQMCLHWLDYICEKEGRSFSRDLLDVEDWGWTPFDLKKGVHAESISYKVIPGIFAHAFCREPVFFAIGEQDLPFYPIAAAENGYECMSEPIEKRGGAFSYVLRLRLVTRGIHAEQKLLNVKVGIRRFVLKPLIRGNDCWLRWNTRSSIYLSLNNPYMKLDRPSFVKLFAERVSDEEKKGQTAWIDPFEQYCSDLVAAKHLATDEIYRQPKEYFQGKNGVRALITYSTSAIPFDYPTIKPGAGLYERKEWLQRFQEKFPQLSLLQPLPKMKVASHPHRRTVPPKGVQTFVLEIWAKERSFLAAVCREIEQICATSPAEITESSYIFPFVDPETGETGWELKVVQRDPGDIVSPLDYKLKRKKAIQKRIGEIRRSVEQAKAQPVMAFVEIEDYPNHKDKQMRELDPKHAVRLGMLRTGRITQFIHPLRDEGKETKSRLQNALLDLFSDRGFLDSRWEYIECDGEFVGFTYLKGTKNHHIVPMMSWFRENEVMVKIGRATKWERFHEALFRFDPLALAEQELSKEHTEEYIAREVERILEQTEKPIYLFVNAALRRDMWKGLANKKIKLDRLPFQNHLERHERLRVIRVNTSDEVPYADIIKADGDISKGQGLYKDDGGIYYSVSERPDTMRARVSANKWENPGTLIAKQRAVEIIPLGCQTEAERDQLAILTHQLRQVHLPYEKHTLEPYPLKRLRTFEKYVESMEEIDYADDFEGIWD